MGKDNQNSSSLAPRQYVQNTGLAKPPLPSYTLYHTLLSGLQFFVRFLKVPQSLCVESLLPNTVVLRVGTLRRQLNSQASDIMGGFIHGIYSLLGCWKVLETAGESNCRKEVTGNISFRGIFCLWSMPPSFPLLPRCQEVSSLVPHMPPAMIFFCLHSGPETTKTSIQGLKTPNHESR